MMPFPKPMLVMVLAAPTSLKRHAVNPYSYLNYVAIGT